MIDKDYRLQIKVKNNIILTLMENMGYKTVKELAADSGINHNTLYRYINLKECPLDSKGCFRATARNLAEFFGVHPRELFSDHIINNNLDKREWKFEISSNDYQFMLENQSEENTLMLENKIDRMQLTERLNSAIDTLTMREKYVVEKRYGVNSDEEHSLEDIANHFGVTRNRIHQIESKALRKLRHPARVKIIHPDEYENDNN